MFLHTLGLRTDGRITSYVHNFRNPLVDRRGSNTPHPCKFPSAIVAHINSFHPQVSHYTRVHAPWRRYLDPTLSVRFLYRDFQQRNSSDKISYATYYKVFRQQRITFGSPKADLCEICEKHKFHLQLTKHTPQEQGQCSECAGYMYHSNNAESARRHYLDDSHGVPRVGSEIYSVDMQRVLLLPIMKQKSCFFTSRLVTFNETFASMSGDSNVCVLWHEGISGRNAPDVSSAIVTLIERRKPTAANLTFWMDNCSAQNKNWCLFLALLAVVNGDSPPETVTIKYLERGHTFNRADSIHGAIGRRLKGRTVCTFEEISTLIATSGKKTECLPLAASNFRNWISLRSQTRELPRISAMRMVEFRKENRALYYKFALDAPNFLRYQLPSTIMLSYPESNLLDRGINEAKKLQICNTLVPMMPAEKRDFWRELPTSSKPDLCAHFD